MDNYLKEIEDEFIRIRGSFRLLSPKEWQLAREWEEKGIPLSIVLRAMSDVQKTFNSTRRADKINSLSYFKQAVEKAFAEYSKLQIGKGKTEREEKPMIENLPVSDDFAAHIESEYLPKYDCKNFADGSEIQLSDLMCKAITKVRSELIALIDDLNQKNPSADQIEKRISAIKTEFEISLIADFSDEERQKMIEETEAEYPKYTHLSEVMQSFLIRKCYTKFGLPELNLYVF